MPVVTTKEILDHAFAERYGVAAFNVVNDLTMQAVLTAAEELRAPVIVQTSVKHVQMTGTDVMYAMWHEMTRHVSVPVSLHLDHCPDRELISECLAKGWSSVLFEASKLSARATRCAVMVASAGIRAWEVRSPQGASSMRAMRTMASVASRLGFISMERSR